MKGTKAMSKSCWNNDEPVAPGATDNLDINIHSKSLIDFEVPQARPLPLVYKANGVVENVLDKFYSSLI